jgi:hypothetical protein
MAPLALACLAGATRPYHRVHADIRCERCALGACAQRRPTLRAFQLLQLTFERL